MVLFPIDTMFLFEMLFQLSRYAPKRMQPCDDGMIARIYLHGRVANGKTKFRLLHFHHLHHYHNHA